jgi:hypothetical protein
MGNLGWNPEGSGGRWKMELGFERRNILFRLKIMVKKL